jgi:Bifunctional DNA primase/polymerase, N-terminal/Primase C terminal 1 (PriCT-1)
MSEESPILVAALALAARGFKVLPVCPAHVGCGSKSCRRGKHPIPRNWQTQSSGDPAQIHKWFKRYPDAGLGIATGPGSNAFVIDTDGPEGQESLARLMEQHGKLPDTLTAITGSGNGRHFYFRYPGVKVITRTDVAPKLDVRGHGGFVVCPPSTHISGNHYAWVDPDATIAEAPDWLVAIVTAKAKPVAGRQAKSSIHPVEDLVIEKGDRHPYLMSAAGRLRASNMDEDQILEHIQAINRDACKPPLNDLEVSRIAASAAKYTAGHKRSSLEARRAAREDSPLFWMPINVAEWLTDREFRFMNSAERGMYMTLILESWASGGVLEHNDDLWKLSGADSVEAFELAKQRILSKFDSCNDEDGNPIFISRIVKTIWNEQFSSWNQKHRAGKASAESKARAKTARIPEENRRAA